MRIFDIHIFLRLLFRMRMLRRQLPLPSMASLWCFDDMIKIGHASVNAFIFLSWFTRRWDIRQMGQRRAAHEGLRGLSEARDCRISFILPFISSYSGLCNAGGSRARSMLSTPPHYFIDYQASEIRFMLSMLRRHIFAPSTFKVGTATTQSSRRHADWLRITLHIFAFLFSQTAASASHFVSFSFSLRHSITIISRPG